MTSPLKVHWKKSIESPLENESPLEKVHWKSIGKVYWKSIGKWKSIESPLEKVHWKKSIESPLEKVHWKYLYDFENFLTLNLLCNLDHYLYDFENFHIVKTSSSSGLRKIFLIDIMCPGIVLVTPTVCHLWLKVSWGSFQSPMVTWITIFMNNPWHWALNEIRLGEHSYSETTSGEAGDYAQNFIFEQKRKEEKT